MTVQQKAKTGKNTSWVGGYVLGVVSVGLIFFVVWSLAGRGAPEAATQSATAAAPPAAAPAPAPATDDHDHEELEGLIAQVPRVTADELKELMDNDAVAIIDVRDVNGFVDGHIPGALQIPLAYVEGEIPWFPRDKKIVTYCTCPAEETSGQAVLILQNGGLNNVAALLGGLDTWRAAGYEVESGMPVKTQ